MFQTKVVHKIKTHFIFNNISFFENHVIYDVMWKTTVQPDRPQMTIRPMHIACWISKATKTYSEYVVLIVFPQHQ